MKTHYSIYKYKIKLKNIHPNHYNSFRWQHWTVIYDVRIVFWFKIIYGLNLDRAGEYGEVVHEFFK